MLYPELGRYPLSVIVKTRIIRYWSILLTGTESRLAVIYYKNMMTSPENYKWTRFVLSILNEADYQHVWINHNNFNLTSIDKKVKFKLLHKFKLSRNDSTNKSSKGTNYRLFKNNIKIEKYFLVLPPGLRISLFQYRTEVTGYQLKLVDGRTPTPL